MSPQPPSGEAYDRKLKKSGPQVDTENLGVVKCGRRVHLVAACGRFSAFSARKGHPTTSGALSAHIADGQ
jgi:hypothetical protein